MTDNYKYELQDLVSTALEQKPVEFEQAFNDLIVDRLQAAVNNKKIQIAQQMYGYDQNESEDTE
jgi:hypothetical protein